MILFVASHDEVTRNILIPLSSTRRSHLSLFIHKCHSHTTTSSWHTQSTNMTPYSHLTVPFLLLSLFLFLRPSPLTRLRYSFSTFVFFPLSILLPIANIWVKEEKGRDRRRVEYAISYGEKWIGWEEEGGNMRIGCKVVIIEEELWRERDEGDEVRK